MFLCIYTLTVSIAYSILWLVSEDAAQASVVGFIALLILPSIYHEWKRTHG